MIKAPQRAAKGKEPMKKTLLFVAVLALAACAGGAGGSTPTTGTIEITGQDYSFGGVPGVVATGAELTFTNISENEVHEMLVFKIVEGETRTIQELLELPDAEVESVAQMQGILVALPGEDGANPEGGGASIAISEPGRYAILCFIPQGADPATVEEAMASGDAEGQPDLGEGTPHALLGMVAEFQVEEA
ncbi:MAG: hypothetical protein ACRDWH_06925 [Acidimicrobiia bacterium]